MKYILGDSITISSSHPSDRGTFISVVSQHTLVLHDGSYKATLSYEEGYDKSILVDYLHYHQPKEFIDNKLEVRMGNGNWLVVEYWNRDEPYTVGILVSVGAHPIGAGTTVSVFIEDSDVPVLKEALRGQL